MLAQTERARGATEPGTARGTTQLPDVTASKPTLADLGLSKRDSAEAQMLASIPRETFDEVKAGSTRAEGGGLKLFLSPSPN